MMKTINCRDDSLAEDRGMWTPMKKKKRCIIVAQGFYEWLKKNGGKEKIPHFTKRKDGHLMCFAGLWDYVQYEGELLLLSAFGWGGTKDERVVKGGCILMRRAVHGSLLSMPALPTRRCSAS